MSFKLTLACLAGVMGLASCGTSAAEPGLRVVAAPAQVEAPSAPTDGATTAAPAEALDGGEVEPAAPEPAEVEAFGPGATTDEVAAAVLPLAEAEAWLAELEAEWDNGMTYSEIFRAWRTVSAETGPILASFDIPADADQAQAEQLAAYFDAVRGAHDEWQSTVDFIVTYITNYTPEILITKAYQAVEVHLRDAAEVRADLGVAAAARPEIVIDDLVEF